MTKPHSPLSSLPDPLLDRGNNLGAGAPLLTPPSPRRQALVGPRRGHPVVSPSPAPVREIVPEGCRRRGHRRPACTSPDAIAGLPPRRPLRRLLIAVFLLNGSNEPRRPRSPATGVSNESSPLSSSFPCPRVRRARAFVVATVRPPDACWCHRRPPPHLLPEATPVADLWPRTATPSRASTRALAACLARLCFSGSTSTRSHQRACHRTSSSLAASRVVPFGSVPLDLRLPAAGLASGCCARCHPGSTFARAPACPNHRAGWCPHPFASARLAPFGH